jgi:hypothetical protein
MSEAEESFVNVMRREMPERAPSPRSLARDPAENSLPPEARMILAALESDAHKKRAAFVASRDQLQDAQRQKKDLEFKIQRGTASRSESFFNSDGGGSGGWGLRSSDPRIVAFKNDLELVTERLNALTKEAARAEAEADEAGALVYTIRQRLEDEWRGRRFTALAPVKLKQVPDDIVAAIEEARTRGRGIAVSIATVRNAILPKAAAMECISAQLDEIAERGRPDLAPVVERRGAKIGWRTGYMSGETSAFEVFVWLNRDELLARFKREIDARWNAASALTDKERAAAIDKLTGELFEAERYEEALIRAAAVRGVRIARRGDADPAAVLGVAIR